MGDNLDFSNLHYGMLNGGTWESVGKPVELHVDTLQGNDAYDDTPYITNEPLTFELECVDAGNLFKDTSWLPQGPQKVDFIYERSIPDLLYPRTVRQAKARRKGNRGNRRREYVWTRIVNTLHGVNLMPNEDGSLSVNWQFRGE